MPRHTSTDALNQYSKEQTVAKVISMLTRFALHGVHPFRDRTPLGIMLMYGYPTQSSSNTCEKQFVDEGDLDLVCDPTRETLRVQTTSFGLHHAYLERKTESTPRFRPHVVFSVPFGQL